MYYTGSVYICRATYVIWQHLFPGEAYSFSVLVLILGDIQSKLMIHDFTYSELLSEWTALVLIRS